MNGMPNARANLLFEAPHVTNSNSFKIDVRVADKVRSLQAAKLRDVTRAPAGAAAAAAAAATLASVTAAAAAAAVAATSAPKPRIIAHQQQQQQQQPQMHLQHHHQHLHDQPHDHHNSQQQPQQVEQPQDQLGAKTNAFLDSLLQNVNLNLVRDMIAYYAIEIVLICVIVTYLIYYFSEISSRPKLIGNPRSKFVKFIKNNLNETLSRRFNPLIYFWGTNPQTALFGYLQGQTSSEEMPRSKFKRQYLYVSDAQYLASNVDLSQHYEGRAKSTSHPPFHLLTEATVAKDNDDNQTHQDETQLGKNIRLALNGMLKFQEEKSASDDVTRVASDSSQHQHQHHDQQQQRLQNSQVNSTGGLLNEHKSSKSSSSSSSSDSGVFGGATSSRSGSSASRSSSASSLSEVLVVGDSSSGSLAAAPGDGGCRCKLLYESPPLLDPDRRSSSSSSSSVALGDEAATKYIAPPAAATATAAAAVETAVQIPPDSERLEFGQCAIDWFLDSHVNYHKHKQVALISAGMTTGSDKKYVTDTVRSLTDLGFEVCVFIRRGVGGLTLTSARFFSPSKWRDFEAAVQSIRVQRPDARLVAVGFSFGSIELCRYLSMSCHESLVSAALLVSCPFDPEAGGRNMRKRALNRKIDAYLAKNLGKQLHWALMSPADPQVNSLESQPESTGSTGFTSAASTSTAASSSSSQLARSHQQLCNYNGSMINLAELPKIKSLVHFEDDFNRRLQNYPTSAAYAHDSRLNEHLACIRTPTLCLSSEDDFMAPLKLLPVDEISANPNLCMLLTKRGGHMAFIDGLLWPQKPYFAQRIIRDYLGAVGRGELLASGGAAYELQSATRAGKT